MFRLVFMFILFLPFGVYADITPKFSYEKSASCIASDGGVIVKLKDESTSSVAIIERIWNRGDGNPNIAGNNPNPSWTYSQPGVYYVNLTVRNQLNETSAVTQVIVVYPIPVVKFVSNLNSGCSPLNVRLTDQTQVTSVTDPATGNIFADSVTGKNWDFGDGKNASGVEAFVDHTYTIAGNKRVRLSLTTREGCVAIGESVGDFIRVLEGVKAAFTLPSVVTCQFPVAVQPTNLSTTGVSYQWSITGPATAVISNSTDATPTFTFSQAGNYAVSLLVKGTNGCTDQRVINLLVSSVSLLNKFIGPDSACDQQTVRFTNQTQPDPGKHAWFVEGIKQSESKDFNYVFQGPGNYRVQLETSFDGCKVVSEKNVRIDPNPVASFSADNTRSCDFPFKVNFSSTSSGSIVRRVWSFGDGFSRTEQSPLGTSTSYTYNRAGTFTVGLTVFSDKGCSSTQLQTGLVSIQPPVVLKTNLPDSGCAPLKLKPEVSFNINALIDRWEWQIKRDDGTNIATSNLPLPDPVELGVGKYLVSLRIVASSGCDKSYVWDVKVGEKPSAFDFSASPTDACANTTFQFKYEGSAVTGYKWKFGNDDSVFMADPARRFKQLGKYDATLTVYNNGCENVLVKKDFLNVRGVIADINQIKDCANPLDKSLLDNSLGNIQQWDWDFGDGVKKSYTTRQQQMAHRYARSGDYTVVLKVSGEGCVYYDSLALKVSNEKSVDFNSLKLPVCIADTFLTLKALVDNPKFIKSYDWNFGCGFTGPVASGAQQKVSISSLCNYTNNRSRGSYTMQLRIIDTNNCVYSSPTKEIFIGGPVSTVSALSPVSGCSNLPVQFQDNTSPDGTNLVVSRIWNFGDGTAPVNILSGPVSHQFARSGDFSVTLTVKDSKGCSSTSNAINIKTVDPDIDFNAIQKSSCLGKPVQFESVTSSALTAYFWDLGDGQSSRLPSPSVSYSAVGKKEIRLTVRDVFGCEATKIKPQYVEIGQPISSFSAEKNIGACPPFNAKFNFNGAFAERFEWNFGDGGTSTAQDPNHLYTKSGVYEVTLKTISPGGCEANSVPFNITVLGPDGTASFTSFSCKPFDTEFTMNSTTAKFVLIDFGDGNVTEAMPYQSRYSYRYTDTGLYRPKIFFSNGVGCTVRIPAGNSIRMIDMQPVFKVDNTIFCGEGTVSFSDLSLSNDNLKGWTWNFGDGSSGSGKNSTHFYDKPGIYDVQLIIQSDLGCIDTLTKKQLIEIRANPKMQIMGSRSIVCEDDYVQFEAYPDVGTNPPLVEWFWDFANGQSSAKPKPDPQQFRKVGTYPMRLYVKDDKGCTDTVFYDFDVNPRPVVDAGSDLQLCLGTPVRLNGTSNAVAEWLPAPSMSCTNCASPFVNPTNDTQYFLRATTAKGCTALDSVRVNVVQRTKVIAAVDTASICVGDGVKLRASGTALYAWSPAVGLSASSVPDPFAKPVASTTYVVEGRDPFSCFITYDTVFVRVNALPAVDAGRDTTLKAGYPLQLQPTYSQDVVKVKWEPGIFLSCDDCKTPVVTPSYAATYTIFAYNQAGCVAKDVINVLATCTKENLFVPNTFSPNGDGMNDVFYPRGRGIEKIRAFRVFNRWGQLIHLRENFFANDQNAGWKGRYYSGDAPTDVYVYMLDVVCENGNIITLKGDVTLLR